MDLLKVGMDVLSGGKKKPLDVMGTLVEGKD